MGKHKEWRKIVKKERRRKLRIQEAKEREKPSGEYLKWLAEQDILEKFEYEQIEKSNFCENQKWLEAEKKNIEQWNILQERKRMQLQEYLQQEAKLKLEWELEQKRKEEAEKRLKEIEEEKRNQQQIFMKKLEQFLLGNSTDPPPELLISHETKPQMEVCPFFLKTGCCRFGDLCSRNHRYPGISKVLLASNFYVHFGLNNANFNEYDTDVMLEYEESDTQKEFVEFFNDVFPEFEKFGRITQFKAYISPSNSVLITTLQMKEHPDNFHVVEQVCNNYEKHLRGNTYVEYAELRCAVAAYQALHSRWYGGRQLSLQFCLIESWKNAICGLASRRRCPKGRACNFLHVFRNPRGFYEDSRFEHKRNLDTSHRSWRWSESPEKEIKYRKRRAEDTKESNNRPSKEKSLRYSRSRRTSVDVKRRLRSPDKTKSRR